MKKKEKRGGRSSKGSPVSRLEMRAQRERQTLKKMEIYRTSPKEMDEKYLTSTLPS